MALRASYHHWTGHGKKIWIGELQSIMANLRKATFHVFRLAHNLAAGGIPSKIISQLSRKSDAWMRENFGKSNQGKETVITMDHMAAPFAIGFSFLILSTLVFVFEVLYGWFQRTRNSKKTEIISLKPLKPTINKLFLP